jgi:EAL domain-containing protein (putative c-di-GMP-specific phosphodiesterase class I)/CheY-like chemotaxis protein
MTIDKTRVLVIDDDVDLTSVVRGALETQGYEVLTACDGERGLELAFTKHPHLVLLDVMMPGLDGYRVCRELQFGYTKDIPVIFLTAKTQLANMMEANRAGASAYITKPFRIEHLLRTVREVLRDASVYVDEITGLPTLANVQVEVQRMLYGHSQLGIVYIALDGVHALEQVQGFEVADDVFRVIAQRLLDAKGELIRSEDFVSVSSLGNAFLIVLSPPRERSAVGDAELTALKERLEERLLNGLEKELRERLLVKLGLYVGWARLTQSPKVRFKRALLEAIDQATRGIQLERDQERRELRSEFDRVVAGRLLSCVCQPILKLDDTSLLGYELLARGPRLSPLHLPDSLFEVARGMGREAELDRICRLAAARTAATLPPGALRFINTEPVSLVTAGSTMLVAELVEATPQALRAKTIVEITESSMIEDFSHAREVVRQLRDQGFRVAVDDAGSGHAGLQTLVEIEPDFIKLDMSLTRGIESSLVRRKLVATMRDFCDGAGITLIAEGIETQAQLDALRELGVPYGQGYLFARPGAPNTNDTLLPVAPSVVESRPL